MLERIIVFKKIIYFTILIIVFSSCNTKKAKENFEDIHKIKKGMSFQEVQKIMRNKPFKKELDEDGTSFTHLYTPPFASSGNYAIEYSIKDSIVVIVWIHD